MAVTDQQKIDFLLKKIGFTKTKTGSVVGTGAISGTGKQPFAEAIPSPLIIANGALWNESDSIPTTPPGSDTAQVKVYLAGTSGLRMTADSTSSGQRAYIAYTTYNNTSSARLTNWIDTQFGSSYLIKVYKGDPNSGGVALSAAGSGSNDGWFFDYSAGVLNFNDTNVPSGVTDTNIYIVGYRYIGQTGAPTPTGGGNFTFNDLTVSNNLSVGGISTFTGNIDANGGITATTGTFEDLIGAGAIVFSTGSGTLDDTANLTYSTGSNTLNTPNILVQADATFQDIDVDGHTNLDNLSVSGISTFSAAANTLNVNTTTVNPALNIQRNGTTVGSLIPKSDGLEIGVISGDNLLMHLNQFGGNTSDFIVKSSGSELFKVNGDGGVVVTGILTATELDVDGHTNLDNVNIVGVATVTGALKIPDGGGSSNRISVGDSEDLKIYHTGNTSTIKHHNGSGDLYLDALATGSDIRLRSEAEFAVQVGGNTHIQAYKNGGTSLSQAGSKKLETLTTGARVTGTLDVTSGITVAGNIDANGDLDVDGHTNLDNVSVAGVTTTAGLLDINAGGQANTFKVEDLTSGRVVLAGTGGELEDSNKLTFDGTTLGLTGNANFTGNLTVGGVLTYEDVKNVDSVGLITARSGIRVTSGVIEAQAGENKIPFLYTAMGNLPSAGSYHGMFAHVHATGRGYFAHAGNWLELVNKETNGTVGTGTETYNIGSLTAPYADIDDYVDVGSNIQLGNAGVVTATRFVGDGDFFHIDVDGHTNLDHVSITGVTTHSGSTTFDQNITFNGSSSTANWIKSGDKFRLNDNSKVNFGSADNMSVYHTGSAGYITNNTGAINISGNLNIEDDLDVDGHINLDNVSVAGVSTFSNNVHVGTGVTVETNGQATFTGIVTASSFKLPDGSNVGGIESDAQFNTVGGTQSGDAFSGISAARNSLYGYGSGTRITSGDDNTHFGYNAGSYTTTNAGTTYIGARAGEDATGGNNTGIGFGALRNSTASNNTAVGNEAGESITSGNSNALFGRFAGNAIIGGSDNVILGYNADVGASSNNNIVIGYEATGSSSNEIIIGNSNHTNFRIPGIGVSFGSSGEGYFSGIVTATSFKGDGSQLTGISVDSTALKDPNGNIKIQAQASGAVHTGIATFQDLDVDGHTNLDNVSVAGVSTFTGAVSINAASGFPLILQASNSSIPAIKINNQSGTQRGQILANDHLNIEAYGNDIIFDPNHGGGTAGDILLKSNTINALVVKGTGEIEIVRDLDVDGHTNLDNVSVAGVSTFSGNINGDGDITLISTDTNSSASPSINLFRNSASPADGDYLGQIKFNGESDTSAQRTYAKITGKILDASNSAEDGIIEFEHVKNGFQTVTGRFRSDSFQLLNGTNFSVAGNSTFTGTAEFDSNARFDSTITAGGGTGSNGQYLKTTGSGVAWESFPTMRTTTTVTASAGQTTFSFSYNVGFLDVFVNGVKLTGSELTATNGSSVVLAVGCFVGDIVELVSYNTVSGGGGGGAGSITVQDEGSSLSTSAGTLNFVGTGVVASGNGSTKTITVNAGAADTTDVRTNTLEVVGVTTFSSTVLIEGNNRLNLRDANAAIYDQGGNIRIDRSGAGGIILKSNASGGDSGDIILSGGVSGDLLTVHGTGDVDILNTLGIGGSITKASGHLDIRASNLHLKNAAGSATYAAFSNGGGAELNFNNTKRFETTNTGANVIGTLTVNGSPISGGGGSGFFSQTIVGIHTLSKVGIGTTNPEFDLDLGSYTSQNVSTASTIRIMGDGASSDNTAIRFGAGGSNVDYTLLRVDGRDGTTDGDNNTDLGFALRYMSAGESGTDNRIAFWADNTNKTKYEALSIYNDGRVLVDNGAGGGHGFYGHPPDHFTVRGSSKLDNVRVVGVSTVQHVLPETDSTYDIGTNTVRVRNIYADTLYGDGSNLTGISGGGTDVGITTNLSGNFTASPGTPATINTFTGYSSDDLVVEYTVYIKNGSDFQSQKLLAMRDGTTIHSTQFAVMFSSSLLVQCDATISSGNILLRATPESGITGTTTYKIKREVM